MWKSAQELKKVGLTITERNPHDYLCFADYNTIIWGLELLHKTRDFTQGHLHLILQKHHGLTQDENIVLLLCRINKVPNPKKKMAESHLLPAVIYRQRRGNWNRKNKNKVYFLSKAPITCQNSHQPARKFHFLLQKYPQGLILQTKAWK